MTIEALDARGLLCPLPVAHTRRLLLTLRDGAHLEVLGDDPLFLVDMQAFCAQEGHAYLGHRGEPGGGWRVAMRKVSASEP